MGKNTKYYLKLYKIALVMLAFAGSIFGVKISSQAASGDEMKTPDGAWKFKVITEPISTANGTCSIFETTRVGDITIPNTVKSTDGKKSYTVVALGTCGEYFKCNPKKKNFNALYDSGIEYDKDDAFPGKWPNVTSIKFAANSKVKVISAETFCCFCGNAKKLKEITFPKSVTYIGANAFEENHHLKCIRFESGSKLNTICDFAFDDVDADLYLRSETIDFYEAAFTNFYGMIYLHNSTLYEEISNMHYVYSLCECGCTNCIGEIEEVCKCSCENCECGRGDDYYEINSVIVEKYNINFKIPTSVGSKKYTTIKKTNIDYGAYVRLNPTYDASIFDGYRLYLSDQSNGKGRRYELNGSYRKITRTGNINLYLIAEPIEYVIKYDSNGGFGNRYESRAIKYNETYNLDSCKYYLTENVVNITSYRETTKTVEERKFLYWNTKSDGTGETYKAGSSIKQLTKNTSITLYAIWEPSVSEVVIPVYMNNGKEEKDHVLKAVNGYVTLPDYTGVIFEKGEFVNWRFPVKLDGDYDEDKIPGGGKVRVFKQRRYYFKVDLKKPSYIIKFDANGGTGTMSPVTIQYNESRTNIISNQFEYSGQDFYGWEFINASGNSIILKEDEINDVLSMEFFYTLLSNYMGDNYNITFKALWNAKCYNVSFAANGGIGYMPSQNYVTNVLSNLPYCSFTKTGYEFSGWAKGDSGVVSYQNGGAIQRSYTEGDLRLVAVWEPVKFTVSFDAAGGTGTMADIQATYGETAYLPACTFIKPGYKFNGWKTSSGIYVRDGYSMQSLCSENGKVLVLTAVWIEEMITVTFDANEGQCDTKTKNIPFNDTCGVLPSADRDGYEFKGWFTSKNGGTQYTSTTIMTSSKPVTLYAKWGPVTNEVSLHGAGGTINGGVKTIKVETGKTIGKLPGAKKKRFTFDGWYTDPEKGEKVTAATICEKDMDLYAHWTAASTGKVKVTLKTKSTKKVKGYVVYYSTSKSFSGKATKSVIVYTDSKSKNLSVIISNLKNGKKYYFRTRAFTTKGKKRVYAKKYGKTVTKQVPKK